MHQEQTPKAPSVPASESVGAEPPKEDSIREELNRVLASHEFRTSKRSQDFLRYVVENTLNGRAEMVKERTIGIDVFGRSTYYDPSRSEERRVGKECS